MFPTQEELRKRVLENFAGFMWKIGAGTKSSLAFIE
jgi:hypothetical protein